MFLKAKLWIRTSKPASLWVKRIRNDKYNVICNEGIVPDCCDEAKLVMQRNISDSAVMFPLLLEMGFG